MARTQKDFTYDHNLLLKAAGLVASTTRHTILDVGAARVDGRVIVDTTAVESATGDEVYTVELQLSNSATFATGVFVQAAVRFGAAALTFESAASPAVARREIAFCNEINGVLYRYAALNTRVVGTIATGINYRAFVVQEG